jgi:predicted dehydrogenase
LDVIRFGVIGLRRGQSFVRVCQLVEGAEVTALYDIDSEKVKTAADELGATAFTDYEAFLNANIDAVVIASPVPFHAEQAILALNAGKHVLSEVTACVTVDEAKAMVAAQAASAGRYMMAENYRYLDEVELLKRMFDDNRFGDVYYGDGEYLHDCKDLWYDEHGQMTWRGRGLITVYCTHSLGPLLYITGDRVATVSALKVPGGKFGGEKPTTMDLMQMTTVGGRYFRVRVDSVSPRPHQMAYYSLQGTRGSFESWRGGGDVSKVWLESDHEPSRVGRDGAQWHPVSDYAERYIPDRLAAPPEARTGGHGTSEYWMLPEFLAAIRGERDVPIDLYRALDYTLPGILAVNSAFAGGAPYDVPDPRTF